ncbi:MAG TPA: ROK family protein [Solirubrobacteraceae bacterium]|jgi:glucokinase|nr:ROK family protein [Solirubrobacteraceae bacterium]
MATHGGIDLGGTKIQAIVMRASDHEVLGQARSLTPHEGGPPTVVDALVDCMTEATDSAGMQLAELSGIGVGVPGEVDVIAGTLAKATNLSEWQQPYPLKATLAERLGTKVRLGNDVSVATHAELLLGAGQGDGSLLAVFWGTGVGGGVALEGRLWHGRGDAGEIGHMVVKQGGARCPCGRKGCMEAYAGRRAMEREAIRLHEDGHHTDLFKIMRERGRETLSSGVWAKALAREDKLAERLIERAVQALGAGVASAVNLLDVQTVLFGGGLGTRFGEPMLARIGAAMQPHLYNDANPPAIKLVALGDLGGALGAALLCAEWDTR